MQLDITRPADSVQTVARSDAANGAKDPRSPAAKQEANASPEPATESTQEAQKEEALAHLTSGSESLLSGLRLLSPIQEVAPERGADEYGSDLQSREVGPQEKQRQRTVVGTVGSPSPAPFQDLKPGGAC